MSRLSWKYRAISFVDIIRRDEVRQTVLMIGYNFLIFGAHTIVKSIQKAQFIHQVGAARLPYVYIGIALVAGVAMQGYSRLARTTRRSRSIIGINLFFIPNILVFWWLFNYKWPPWLSYVFYIWAGIFSAVSIAQFWLIVNEVFSIRQAKRLLGYILSGGTLGAILAGVASRVLVQTIGTGNLFLITVAQLLGCAIIATRINFQGSVMGAASRTSPADQDIGGAFALIRRNKHLTMLAMIIGVTVIATTLVDFQFNSIIGDIYKEKDDLTGFFGSYYAYINVVTVLFQLLVARRVLNRFGVGIAILIMPAGLFLGSATILFQATLWAAVFVRTCEDILNPSINKWGIEILYIPIPASVKSNAKAFIDVVVERTSKGIGGLLLLFLTLVLPLKVRQLSIPTFAFLVVWIFLCIRIYKEYIASVKATIRKRSLNIDTLAVDLSDSSTIKQLFPLLDGENERQIIYALELLQDVQDVENPELAKRIQSLCSHSAPEVRTLALRVLFNIGVPARADLIPDLILWVERLLEDEYDENEEVRAEAMHYVSVYGEVPAIQRLQSFLADPDYRMRSAAITCITRYGGDEERALLTRELIEVMLSEEGPHRRLARLGAAKALGELGADLRDHLLGLLNDEDVDVARQAVSSAGRSRCLDFVPYLIEKLSDPTIRVSVRKALAAYGADILNILVLTMVNQQSPISIRRQIPKVIGMIPHQDSVNVLLGHFDQDEIDMRYKMIRALGELKAVYSSVQFDVNLIEDYVVEGIRKYYHLSFILEAQNHDASSGSLGHPAGTYLLQQALQERLELYKEMIFRLLGLIYPWESVYIAYRGVASPYQRVRDSALELLDNILSRRIKRMLFPIIDNSPKTVFMERASAIWALQPMTDKEAITALINGRDNWIKACTLHAVGERRMVELEEYVDEARSSPDPLIHESAELAWRKLRQKV